VDVDGIAQRKTARHGGAWRHPWRAILLVILTLTGLGYGWPRVATGNFHTVVPGTLYRSGQLTERQWITALHHYGIRSVLNLRGAHPASAWYQREVQLAAQHGVAHYDVRMSAIRELDPGTRTTILALLRQAPKPLLIHCQSGADRAGLIAALYLFALEGQQAEIAGQQLSLFYGHVPYFWSRSGAMDRSFWRYVGHASLAP
jgi:protein tyrosine/serine phosphatase